MDRNLNVKKKETLDIRREMPSGKTNFKGKGDRQTRKGGGGTDVLKPDNLGGGTLEGSYGPCSTVI